MKEIGINFYYKQFKKFTERVCGDYVAHYFYKEQDRIVIILADGLGSGIKACVLSTMAANIILKYLKDEKDIKRVAQNVLKYLPRCSIRKIKYSTFTIIEIEKKSKVKLVEYGNPPCIVLREKKVLDINRNFFDIETDTIDTRVYYSEFYLKKDDIIIAVSDGITQAGMGKDIYPAGWRVEGLINFIEDFLQERSGYDSEILVNEIMKKAYYYDKYKNLDDMSCVALLFRNVKTLLIATGVPQSEQDDKKFATYFWNNSYQKVICGGTTTKVLLREINVDDSEIMKDGIIPDSAKEKGVQVITEGMIVLNELLEKLNNIYKEISEIVEQIYKLIQKHDKIIFLVGLKVNTANLIFSEDYDLRQKIVKKISKILEEKFFKTIELIYY